MTYQKYQWQDGETVTAEKLNHMEDGIYDGFCNCEGSGSSGVTQEELEQYLQDNNYVTVTHDSEYVASENLELYLANYLQDRGYVTVVSGGSMPASPNLTNYLLDFVPSMLSDDSNWTIHPSVFYSAMDNYLTESAGNIYNSIQDLVIAEIQNYNTPSE